jgi:hypothetical protein
MIGESSLRGFVWTATNTPSTSALAPSRAVLVDVTDDREVPTTVHLHKDRIRAGP